MEVTTHGAIEARLCGEVRELSEGFALVELKTGTEMRTDERGLVHGGFLFGLADYAAMLAVNHPNVVLGSAQVRFLRPVRVGDTLIAEATLLDQEGNKKIVTVDVHRGEEVVLTGEFICFTPAQHVLHRSDS
ncbi:MAG: hotdog domain-containing protein [Thermoanaerobaculia bacterium]